MACRRFTVNLPFPNGNPVVASGLDLVGVLFFVVVAIISALSKKAQQGPLPGDEETPRPTRRPAPRRVAPPGGSPANVPPPMAEPSLEGEMRRFLEEMRREQGVPHPEAPPPPPPKVARPEFVPQRTPTTFTVPRKPSHLPHRTPVPMPVPEDGGEGPHTPALADTGPDMRAELGRSLDTLHSEMEVTHTELREVAPASMVEGAADRKGTRFDPAMLRTPESARQAVLLSEILGPPRAMKPW